MLRRGRVQHFAVQFTKKPQIDRGQQILNDGNQFEFRIRKSELMMGRVQF